MAENGYTTSAANVRHVTPGRIALACVAGTLEALGIGALAVITLLTFLHPDHPIIHAVDCVMEASR